MEGIEAGRTGGISLPPERYNGQSIRRWSRGLEVLRRYTPPKHASTYRISVSKGWK